MSSLCNFLSPKQVKLDQLLLDPNNPRFAELGEPLDLIREERFIEKSVQDKAYQRMKDPLFDVSELKDTIKMIGFLPMDKIVVRPWHGTAPDNIERYLVVEGNRRVTALKWLIEQHDGGKENLSEEQLANFANLDVLLLDDVNAPSSTRWVLPGLRHVSGIKKWGPYQQARTVFALRDSGVSAQEAAQSLGLSVTSANRLWRSYLALNQMGQDEEFKEQAVPKLYSYFEEVFKRPSVKDWLDWSDAEKKFTNEANLREFYTWVVGDPTSEDEEEQEAKLPESKSVRELGTIIQDENAFALFRSPSGSLGRAMQKFESDNPEEWLPQVVSTNAVLKRLSADSLRELSEQQLKEIQSLQDRISRVIADSEKLKEA